MLKEFQFIEYVRKLAGSSKNVRLGIGDDCAWLDADKNGGLLITTDVLVDGVDFLIKEQPPRRIGYKALAVNLSDIAAMGGQPEYFLVSLGIPKETKSAWLKDFYRGMMKLAGRNKVECVGGDLSRAAEFFVSITVLGKPGSRVPVTRSQARVKDWIGVTGSLGGSILKHHLSFTPRLPEGFYLAQSRSVHAMIDVSDGLVQDLEHLLVSSRCGAEINLKQIPVSRDALKLAKNDSREALKHALSDGEDFELLFTASPRQKKQLDENWHSKFPKTGLSWIGRCTQGPVKIKWFEGDKRLPDFKPEKKGYTHF